MSEVKKITLIYPYYENPGMFVVHQREWLEYNHHVREFEVIIVDDCSVSSPASENVIVPKNFPLRIYRINKKVDWNWRAARNIGAHAADTGSWLLLTDMDHLVPRETFDKLKKLIAGKVNNQNFYTFDRVLAPVFIEYKNHPNSYFLHRSLYLTIGGYDEIVSGWYGLDGVFRRRLERGSKGAIHLNGYKLYLYKRDVISDASLDASVMARKEHRDKEGLQKVRDELKSRFQSGIRPLTLSFPYERVL